MEKGEGSTLAWRIPWTEEPGGQQSMGSLGVGHDWATSLSHFTFMHWRRKWQPTPVFLPGESQGRRGLVGCYLWGRTELDTTEATQQQQLGLNSSSFTNLKIRRYYYLQEYIFCVGSCREKIDKADHFDYDWNQLLSWDDDIPGLLRF